ncbi:magnesium/cobalt transporter CorA [Candidatus Woesearchaeota archaeon]|nr:magnesium/cobalt transporter CorA [Candidatus Woesearchaeota archaeon]
MARRILRNIHLLSKKSPEAGLPPGTVVYVGEKKKEKVSLELIDYTKGSFVRKNISKVENALPFKEKPTITWLNITGIHDTEIIAKVGKYFRIHPLVREDIANTKQRPKVEDFDRYLFLVLKMIIYDERKKEIRPEQISFIIGPNFVISFQERRGDVFDPIRNRLSQGKGKIRRMGTDYLAYSLIDAIVDHYFTILEHLGEKIENMEDTVLKEPHPELLDRIHKMKRDMVYLRKSVWPLREVLSKLQRRDSPLIKKSTEIYLGDLYDHTIQVIDQIEAYRDTVTGLIDVYMSSVSNKMNEIMKVLTIFAAIFIPLTFVAGVYGMNFEHMPELDWRYGYYTVWGVMVLIGTSMLMYFRRKEWL